MLFIKIFQLKYIVKNLEHLISLTLNAHMSQADLLNAKRMCPSEVHALPLSWVLQTECSVHH